MILHANIRLYHYPINLFLLIFILSSWRLDEACLYLTLFFCVGMDATLAFLF